MRRPLDRLRRYCGLPWSGGPPETWAWRYYDCVPTAEDDVVQPTDVLAAAALHPGLAADELAVLRAQRRRIGRWLAEVPAATPLWRLDEAQVDHLVTLPEVLPEVGVVLLSKVLHRKRPDAIPLLDRSIVDWYHAVVRERDPEAAWAPLVRAMRAEQLDDHQRLITAIAVGSVQSEVSPHLPPERRRRPSWLRATDIVVWMERHPGLDG